MTEPRLDRLERWFERVRAKTSRGAIEYGDRSFELRGDRIVEEMRDELADVCGWAHVLDERLERCAAALERVESLLETEAALVRALSEFRRMTEDVGAPVGPAALEVVSRVRDVLQRAGVDVPHAAALDTEGHAW